MPPSPPPPARDPGPSVTVVVAVRDDAAGLPAVLAGLPPVDELIVVDGGSSGAAAPAVRRLRPDALLVRPTRSGRGDALARGIAAGTGDVVVTLNGDGTADPGEIPGL